MPDQANHTMNSTFGPLAGIVGLVTSFLLGGSGYAVSLLNLHIPPIVLESCQIVMWLGAATASFFTARYYYRKSKTQK